MTDFHLGPLFRFIPDGEQQLIYTWPKIKLRVNFGNPIGYNPVATDVVCLISTSEDEPIGTYDYKKFFPEFGIWAYGDYVKPSTTFALQLRLLDYPITTESPDSPNGGTYHYTTGTVTTDLSVDIPRRFMEFNVPAAFSDGSYGYYHNTGLLNPDNEYREWNATYVRIRWPIDMLPDGTKSGCIITPPALADYVGTFPSVGSPKTFNATVDIDGYGTFTADYTVDRFSTQTVNFVTYTIVEFWTVDSPLLYV